MSPRKFFDQYVVPSLNDLEADSTAAHRAVSALSNIDALAEEVWSATGKQGGSQQYRKALKARCIELASAWDVHDIHKHGLLTRRTPILPNRNVARAPLSFSIAQRFAGPVLGAYCEPEQYRYAPA